MGESKRKGGWSDGAKERRRYSQESTPREPSGRTERSTSQAGEQRHAAKAVTPHCSLPCLLDCLDACFYLPRCFEIILCRILNCFNFLLTVIRVDVSFQVRIRRK